MPSAPTVESLVATALDGVKRPTLVLGDPPPALDVPDVVTVRLGEPRPEGSVRSVLLVVDDLAALRRAASRVDDLPWARQVGVVVRDAAAALTLRPHPSWPALLDLDARLVDGAALTWVQLASGVEAGRVLVALARAAGPAVSGPDGLRVAVAPGLGHQVPPADPTVRGAYDAAAELPPDVVVGGHEGTDGPPPSAVTGRAPTLVAARDPLLGVGPLDEALLNPRGFLREASGAVVDLEPGDVLGPALVQRLRPARAVRVEASTPVRSLAGLAMAGVPLVGSLAPEQRAGLGEEVADLIESEGPDGVALADPLGREEHSVRLRRAALVAHSSLGWRARVAERAGSRPVTHPSVSVLLATRRPEMLDHALAQVARQRRRLPGAEVEVVLAAHGFAPDAARVAEALGDLRHTVVVCERDLVFGDVLNAAGRVASGDLVLKLDDDDWYGPDVVTDLLLARRYSGAALVGMPAEMVYLESIDTTVRRRGPSENHGTVVAGGTMLLERSLLRGLGGFRPVPRHVDAALLDDVRRACGEGSVYRTHGLGYLLRRTDAAGGAGAEAARSGHTWEPGLDYFLRPESLVARWSGFAPSRLVGLS